MTKPIVILVLLTLAVLSTAASVPKPKSKVAKPPKSIAHHILNDELSTSERQAVSCGSTCSFTLCNGDPEVPFSIPNIASAGPICRRNQNTPLLVLSTGEAEVTGRGVTGTPISEYNPAGLTRRFLPNFITVFETTDSEVIASGVGHRRLRGNQNEFLDGLCANLPLSSIEESGNVVDLNDTNDCIAFNIRVPKLLIELEWDTGDDLELSVTEPDGEVLNLVNRRTNSGVFVRDVVSNCGLNLVRREEALYLPSPRVQNGTYTVEATQFNNCGNGPTVWNINVYFDGVLEIGRSGRSNRDDNEQIIRFSFNF